MTSSRVALTAAFLALAAGGTAACDATAEEDDGYTSTDTTTYGDSGGTSTNTSGGTGSGAAPALADLSGDVAESTDEVFYCADDQGEIVDEDYCDTDDETTNYFLWHSPGYPRGLKPGTSLDGGDYISAGDRGARRAFKLPATGKVTNGTIKTNVVGRSSVGSGSGSGSDSSVGSGSSIGGDSAGG